MNTIKTLTRYALYTLLCLVFLTGCKQTYYQYDIEEMEKVCKERGGINRFNSDLHTINCFCNDGTHHMIK